MSKPVGDLPNVVADDNGKVMATIEDVKATISCEIDVTGKAMVIHKGKIYEHEYIIIKIIFRCR